MIRILVISFFVLISSVLSEAQESQKLKIDYLSLNSDDKYQFVEKTLTMLRLPRRSYSSPIEILQSKVLNMNATKVRKITHLKLEDSVFVFAKLPGVFIENCWIKNVHFIHSDLSFVKFKNCKIENLNIEKSITYGMDELH